jgi:hypothetical protein
LLFSARRIGWDAKRPIAARSKSGSPVSHVTEGNAYWSIMNTPGASSLRIVHRWPLRPRPNPLPRYGGAITKLQFKTGCILSSKTRNQRAFRRVATNSPSSSADVLSSTRIGFQRYRCPRAFRRRQHLAKLASQRRGIKDNVDLRLGPESSISFCRQDAEVRSHGDLDD